VVLLINDTETYVETCVCLKLSKLLNKEHVEVFTKILMFDILFRSVAISFPSSAELTKFETLIKCMLLNLEISFLGRDARNME
jgi:hypothetical protein